jgi:hypothetical protein
MNMFRSWFQQPNWQQCLSVLPKINFLLRVFCGQKVQRLVSVVKMAIVLEDCTSKEHRSVVCAEDIHKEIFPVYGGTCRAVHNWVANVSLMTKRLKRRCGSGWDNSQKTSKLGGFNTLVKWWDKCVSMLLEDMSRNDFFQDRILNVLRSIYICGLFTDSPQSRYQESWLRLEPNTSLIHVSSMTAVLTYSVTHQLISDHSRW